MLRSGGHNVDPRGVDVAVAENIGEFRQIILSVVKGAGEKLAQVMGKHLGGVHHRSFAKGFHFLPDHRPMQRVPLVGAKDRTGTNMLFADEFNKLSPQLGRNKHHPCFSFAGHGDLAPLYGFGGKIGQLRNADTGAADGLQNQIKPRIAFRRVQQAEIFGLGELLFFGAKGRRLEPDTLYAAILPPQKTQQTVDRSQHGIDAAHGVAHIDELFFIGHHRFFAQLLSPQKAAEGFDISHVLFQRGAAFFLKDQVTAEIFHIFIIQNAFHHVSSPLSLGFTVNQLVPLLLLYLSSMEKNVRTTQL